MTGKDNNVLMFIMQYCGQIKETIERFGEDFNVFESDNVYSNSVSFIIWQMGECVNKLSKGFKNSTANDVRWDRLCDMGNRVIHDYENLGSDLIWETATQDVPKLLEFCEKNVNVEE